MAAFAGPNQMPISSSIVSAKKKTQVKLNGDDEGRYSISRRRSIVGGRGQSQMGAAILYFGFLCKKDGRLFY